MELTARFKSNEDTERSLKYKALNRFTFSQAKHYITTLQKQQQTFFFGEE